MSSDRWPPSEIQSPSAPDDGPGPLPRPSLRLTGVFVGIVAIGLLVAWVLGGNEPTDQARVGSAAPDFTVEVIGGGTFTLSRHLAADGRPLVVNLWASWCLPCRDEVPEISAFSEANPGVKVIGVAVEDSEEASIEFAEELSPAYDLALGTPEFEDAYPRIGLPVTYVIDSDGEVVEAFNGILDQEGLEGLVPG